MKIRVGPSTVEHVKTYRNVVYELHSVCCVCLCMAVRMCAGVYVQMCVNMHCMCLCAHIPVYVDASLRRRSKGITLSFVCRISLGYVWIVLEKQIWQ